MGNQHSADEDGTKSTSTTSSVTVFQKQNINTTYHEVALRTTTT